MRTFPEIQQQFPGSPLQGLSSNDVVLSRQLFGLNRLTPSPHEPVWKKFLAKFDEPIIGILLAAALLSMLVDLFRPPAEAVRYGLIGAVVVLTILSVGILYLRDGKGWVPSVLFLSAFVLFLSGAATGHTCYDGLAVMVAILLATGVAFVSEYKSERQFEVLNARKEPLRAQVLRDGQFQTLEVEELVVGDVVLLETGEEVPADGRVIEATELHVDQSLLTGESQEVPKEPQPLDETADGPEQSGCLYRGTLVVAGLGRMVVTEVGDETYLGHMARRLADDRSAEKKLTPLQEKLKRLAGVISKVGYLAAGTIFFVLLVRGTLAGEVYWPGSFQEWLDVTQQVLGYFMYMVIIIVVAVPEGLPMSVTVSLALAMRKMTRANSLVRQLVACETIGSATVICTDKTGTLTQNRMQVVRLGWDGQTFDRGRPEHWPPLAAKADPVEPLDWIILQAAVNATANLEVREGKSVPVGNSTEGAFLLWLREGGIDYTRLRLQFPTLYQVPFSSQRKRMATVVRQGPLLIALVKGAPEWVLENCSWSLTAQGGRSPTTTAILEAIRGQLDDAAHQGLRTLAFAFVPLPPETAGDVDVLQTQRDLLERDLIFAGFAAIGDPLRPDVPEAMARCRRAGIDVKMVTGDNVETARAIAAAAHLHEDADPLVLTSREFNDLGDEQLLERLPHLRILARARPLDKYRLVQLLQARGEVVAVTGDGANDAPALKQADVGLAMGLAGTEVAKEASKIVLLDDAFSTIVKAVHWGRALYENIQRFLQFQLTINVAALAIALLGPFLGVKAPFTILQLLWINIIMDTFAAIALCSEPPRPALMKQQPKGRGDNLLTRPMLWTIFSTAVFFVVTMLELLLGMTNGWWLSDPQGQRTRSFPELTTWQVAVFFTTFVFFQVWNEINCRSLAPEVSGLRGLHKNPTFLAIVVLIVVGQVLLVTFGGDLFEVRPLGLLTWLGIAGATASVLAYGEAVRRIRRAVGRKQRSMGHGGN
jgi:Ca2+-transporting ATPase